MRSRVAGADPLPGIRAMAERVARSYGLELFDVQLRRESAGWVLRVILDRHTAAPESVAADGESVSINDCQRVSQDLSALLDVEDPFEHAYTLEVSSPGLDRPLRHADDYRRFAGRLAKIVTAEAVDGQRHFAGRLAGLDDSGAVLLETDRGEVRRVPLEIITRGRLEVEF